LNPDLGYDPPELDDIRAMPLLMTNVANILNGDMLELVKQVARELVASSFYFEQSSYLWEQAKGHFKCEGVYLSFIV
jgi:hypothetical protein